MGVCRCGRKVGGNGKQCRRCSALQELGLEAGASASAIKSRYRLQVKEWHPDLHGKNKARQLAAEEKTKRINIAYRFLTAPSKRGDVPHHPRSPATTEHSRPHASSAPVKKGPLKEAPYPHRDFREWEAQFMKQPINGSKAGDGLKKWIAHETAQRASDIAFMVNNCRSLGVEPNLKTYPKPEDARADVMRSLWRGSVPNLNERTLVAKSDVQFLEQMEKLKVSLDSLAKRITRRNATLVTQDGVFHLSLEDVLHRCIHLSTAITTVSALVRREYIQPLKLADCCIALVWELEKKHHLSQAECHELIKHALLAHGCTETAPFDIGSVDRGTIRARKEALANKVLDSVNVIAQVMQESKRQNVGSAAPMKKSPL